MTDGRLSAVMVTDPIDVAEVITGGVMAVTSSPPSLRISNLRFLSVGTGDVLTILDEESCSETRSINSGTGLSLALPALAGSCLTSITNPSDKFDTGIFSLSLGRDVFVASCTVLSGFVRTLRRDEVLPSKTGVLSFSPPLGTAF
jgi:hypothetical protein